MKAGRLEKITELVEKYDIETQEELRIRLIEAGFDVTQATVSRDIRALRLTKIPVNGKGSRPVYRIQRTGPEFSEKHANILKDGILSVDHAQNIMVIKTISGMAMAVAVAIDALKLSEIVGCIAGDDTIMAAIRSTEECIAITGRIKEMIRG